MCGITGLLDFSRDVRTRRALVEEMTRSLHHRGPDAQGVWIEGHAGLGHTRNSVIDLEGGIQPMVATEDGRQLAVLTYSGEIYNFRQLRSRLESHGHRFRTRSDTEVVLRAYLQWGADCARHLEGMFAFAVWDLREERLVLIRDRLGIKPLFYTIMPHGVIFASEPKALLASRMVQPVVDREGIRELFSSAKTPGQAVFRDMRELLPGHVLTVSRKGAVLSKYWELEPRRHTDDLKKTISTIREMLEEIVTRELVADVPLCSLLSGGLDSSSVTAIAAIARRRAGDEPLRTITTNFVGYSENFRSDDTRDTPDAPYAAEVARHVGSEHTDIVLGTADIVSPEVRAAALIAQDMPTTLGDMDTSGYLMLRATKEHSTVALSGETADEIFGGFKWLYERDVVEAENYPWVAREKRHAGSRTHGLGRGLFDQGFLEKIDMPGYYRDSYQQARAAVPHQEGESPEEHRMRELCHFHIARWLPMLLDRTDRLAMASALEVRVPFCDHRLVQYVYNIPWSFKVFDGREKSLLRAAVADLLPPQILSRPKSPWPVTQDPAYTRWLQRNMTELLSDADSPVLQLIDVEATKRAVADTSEVANEWQSRVNIETLLQFDLWLRRYRVELNI